jgi:hypothetical protein
MLPEDAKAIREFNSRADSNHRLQIEKLLPEPFVGDPAAPVLLLSNNPGFGKSSVLRQKPEFKKRMRSGLNLRSSVYPFTYLDPKFEKTGRWWRQKLKCLLLKFGAEVVARSVCNVVYFPTHQECSGTGAARYRHSSTVSVSCVTQLSAAQ